MAAGTFSIAIIDSKKSGAQTAVLRLDDGRELFLHSRFDPIEEARFLIDGVPLQERTLYVVFGFGLGYHIKELLARIPATSHIVVSEPDSACLSHSLIKRDKRLGALAKSGRVHFLASRDPGVAVMHLAEVASRLRLLSVRVVTHLPSTFTAQEFYAQALATIQQSLPAAIDRHLLALDRILEHDLQNFWANIPHSWNAAPFACLRGKWTNQPLVIVSAGPSLTAALPDLRTLQGRALLVATGPTARVLLADGIQPDVVVTLDVNEPNLAHFTGWDTSATPLFYYHRTYRGVLSGYRGPTCSFTMRNEPPLPLTVGGEASPFAGGGTVAFSALQLAHYLGANPIIFVGQDFSFPGGHTHATGTAHNTTYDPPQSPGVYFNVPGVDGNPVTTNRTYYEYMLLMQAHLRDLRRSKPHVRHVNTSKVGARIDGMDHDDLGRVASSLGSAPAASPTRRIADALDERPRASPEARTAALNGWIAELSKLLDRQAATEDVGQLFAALRNTSFYTHAGPSYDDVWYVYESRYRGQGDRLFRDRVVRHLQSALDALEKAKSAATAG